MSNNSKAWKRETCMCANTLSNQVCEEKREEK